MTEKTNQGREAVSKKIASLNVQAAKLTSNQVQEAVSEAINSLESKAIFWSEILDVMSNIAFRQGKPQLATLMATSAQQAWEVEINQD